VCVWTYVQVQQLPADMGNRKDLEYPLWLEGTWQVKADKGIVLRFRNGSVCVYVYASWATQHKHVHVCTRTFTYTNEHTHVHACMHKHK
jgi:hypothetical protein